MSKRALGLFGVAGLGFALACGGSDGSSSGSSNQALVGSTWGALSSSSWLLRVASFTDVCAELNQMSETANSSQLEITLNAATGQTTLPPGTYTVTNGGNLPSVSAKFKSRDGSCSKTVELDATSGNITLSSTLGITGQTVGGSFDLQLGDGSHRSGTFSASSCNVTSQGGSGICVGGSSSGSGGASGGSGTGGSPGSGGSSSAACVDMTGTWTGAVGGQPCTATFAPSSCTTTTNCGGVTATVTVTGSDVSVTGGITCTGTVSGNTAQMNCGSIAVTMTRG